MFHLNIYYPLSWLPARAASWEDWQSITDKDSHLHEKLKTTDVVTDELGLGASHSMFRQLGNLGACFCSMCAAAPPTCCHRCRCSGVAPRLPAPSRRTSMLHADSPHLHATRSAGSAGRGGGGGGGGRAELGFALRLPALLRTTHTLHADVAPLCTTLQVQEQRAEAEAAAGEAASDAAAQAPAEARPEGEAERLLQGQRAYYNMVHAVK